MKLNAVRRGISVAIGKPQRRTPLGVVYSSVKYPKSQGAISLQNVIKLIFWKLLTTTPRALTMVLFRIWAKARELSGTFYPPINDRAIEHFQLQNQMKNAQTEFNSRAFQTSILFEFRNG